MHVCIDDATRLAYAEVLPDERGPTAAGFLRRAVSWFFAMGITIERVMSDNGSCYRAAVHAAACRELGLKHLRTQPYRPRTNGKAERFIQTLKNRWAYGALYGTSAERTSPTRLACPLQHQKTPWLPRPPTARSSARRAGTTSWVATTSRALVIDSTTAETGSPWTSSIRLASLLSRLDVGRDGELVEVLSVV